MMWVFNLRVCKQIHDSGNPPTCRRLRQAKLCFEFLRKTCHDLGNDDKDFLNRVLASTPADCKEFFKLNYSEKMPGSLTGISSTHEPLIKKLND